MNAPTARGSHRVHLNTAGVGRMPATVRAVLTECTRREDRYGRHHLEEHLDGVLHTEIHERLGALLDVPAADTVLFTGAADAYATVLPRLPLGPRDRVWTTPYEGVAALTTLLALRDRTRCRLEVVPLRPDGDLDLDWMAGHIDDDVALVTVPYVPSGCGIVNPVEAVGRILAPYRCLYAVDASYAVGQIPVDAARIGCHLLTGDGWRFLCGPQGVGFAYTAPRLREALAPPGVRPAVLPPSPAVAALTAALSRRPASGAGHEALALRLRAAVEAVPGTELIAPGRTQSGIVAFRHAELPAALVRRRLADQGVVVWKTVAAETPLLPPGPGLTTAVRASVHHDNSPEDIARFEEALREAVATGGTRPAQPEVRTTATTATMAITVTAATASAATATAHPAHLPPPRRHSPRRRHLTLVGGPTP